MALDLPRFYEACNPAKTGLNPEDPEERKYYIDFSSVRGTQIIEEMERTIAQLSPDKPTCQLFTGHIGCGKTTELLRLKNELKQAGFHVVYFEATDDIAIGDVDISDILLSIVRHVSASLKQIGIILRPNYFQKLFSEIIGILNTPIEFKDVEFSVGIAKITAQTKASPIEREKLRAYLEPQTANLIESINDDILQPAIERLTAKGQKGLVVIIDNLDRMDNILKANGHTQPEYIFVDRGEQLTKLQCHVVYTIPPILTFSNQLGMLENRFGGNLNILPMVRVRSRNGKEFEEGMNKLREMVLARAFPNIEAKLRFNSVTEVFDFPETLDCLCRISGGHVRNVLILLYGCLRKQNPPISRQSLEDVIRGQRDMLRRGITSNQLELLTEVGKKQWVSGEEKYQSLIHSLFVFEYQDENDTWFEINPLLSEIIGISKNL
jgi:hypothetical protein